MQSNQSTINTNTNMKPTIRALKNAARTLAGLPHNPKNSDAHSAEYFAIEKLQMALGKWRADGECKEHDLFTTDPHGEQTMCYLADDGSTSVATEEIGSALFTLRDNGRGNRINMTGEEVDSFVKQWQAYRQAEKPKTDVTAHEYTEAQMNTIGDRIAKILHMKRDREYCDRWQTTFGNKTGKGLFLTLSRFIHEVEQNHPDSELLK